MLNLGKTTRSPQSDLTPWILTLGSEDEKDKTAMEKWLKENIIDVVIGWSKQILGAKSEISYIQIIQVVNIVTSFSNLKSSAQQVYTILPTKVILYLTITKKLHLYAVSSKITPYISSN